MNIYFFRRNSRQKVIIGFSNIVSIYTIDVEVSKVMH